MLKKIAKRLKKADSVAIFTHLNPDGDALGSSFALKYALESLGKKAVIYLEKEMPEKYNFLGTDYEIADEKMKLSEDVAVVLDCGDYGRLGNCAECCKSIKTLFCIDHHKTGDSFGELYYNEPTAAATAQIIYELVNLINKKSPVKAFEAIYTGMSTDTGHFKFSNVSPKTFEIASKVLERGIDHRKITSIIYDTVKREKMIFLGAATEKIKMYMDGRVAVLDCPESFLAQYGLTYDDVDELPNIPLNLEGVEASVLVKDRDEASKRVSLRTKDAIDVSEVAKLFSGGGHKAAAACILSGNIEENLNNLINTIIEKLGEKDV